MIPAGMGSDLDVLLSAWGVEYQDDRVLADNELALRVRMSQNERPMPHLGMVVCREKILIRKISSPAVLRPSILHLPAPCLSRTVRLQLLSH